VASILGSERDGRRTSHPRSTARDCPTRRRLGSPLPKKSQTS
jgi:hypothetical protein